MATTLASFFVGLGGSQALGLFVMQLNSGRSLGLASLTLAFALVQAGLGKLQPLLGQLADRAGAHRRLFGSTALFVLATLLPLLSVSGWIVFGAFMASAMASVHR